MIKSPLFGKGKGIEGFEKAITLGRRPLSFGLRGDILLLIIATASRGRVQASPRRVVRPSLVWWTRLSCFCGRNSVRKSYRYARTLPYTGKRPGPELAEPFECGKWSFSGSRQGGTLHRRVDVRVHTRVYTYVLRGIITNKIRRGQARTENQTCFRPFCLLKSAVTQPLQRLPYTSIFAVLYMVRKYEDGLVF